MPFQPYFQPRYVLESELEKFGLPTIDEQPNIMALVDGASSLIDETCGRTDGDGNGSLVITTYFERMLLPEGRNIFRTMFKPLKAVDVETYNELVASGSNFYTGFQPNTAIRTGVGLTPLIGASGRYGYARRGGQMVYPDLNYGANILQIASFFGGPPNFTPIDITATDFDTKTGEVWVPAGLYLSQYTEIIIGYNSGWDPRAIPVAIKHACSALIKNLLSRGGGTTGLKSMNAGRVNASFTDDLIDTAIERWLRPYYTVLAY